MYLDINSYANDTFTWEVPRLYRSRLFICLLRHFEVLYSFHYLWKHLWQKFYEQTFLLRKSARCLIPWYFCSIRGCGISRVCHSLDSTLWSNGGSALTLNICSRSKVAAKADATKYSVCDYYGNEFIDTCSEVDFMPTIQNVRREFQSTFYAFHTGARCTSDDSKYSPDISRNRLWCDTKLSQNRLSKLPVFKTYEIDIFPR